MSLGAGHEVLADYLGTPGANAQDLTQQQIPALRALLEEDLYLFAWVIFKFHDLTPTLHGRISTLLSRWGQPGWERLMIQIPREFFKTSVCTRANSLWQICRDPDAPVCIFNERLENSAKWVRSVREVVSSNALFQTLWRDLLPPGVAINDPRSMPRMWKWTDTELLFQRGKIFPEASLTGMGVGAASAGGHWPKLILDDIISEDARDSPLVMASAIEWADNSVYLEQPAIGGMVLVACTPWAYNDVYAHMLGKYPYKLYRRQALEEAESIFPSKITTEQLLAHQDRDPIGFAAMMMCQPRPGKEQSFEAGWVRYFDLWVDPDTGEECARIDGAHYDPKCREDTGEDYPAKTLPLWQLEKVLFWDPAPSEAADRRREDKARNALVMEGIDVWGRRFILDEWAGREDPYDVIEQVFRMLKEWGCTRLAPEEVNFSKLYRHWVGREATLRKVPLHVSPVTPDRRSKDARIAAKIPDMRRGIYYWNRARTPKLRQEYLEYPYGATRDLLDALAYDRDKLTRGTTSQELYEARLGEKLQPTPYSTRYF